MNKSIVSFIFIISIIISGCSKNEIEESKTGDEIQEVINKEGWKSQVSTENVEAPYKKIILTLNSIQSIEFKYNEEDKEIKVISFIHDFINQQYIVMSEKGNKDDYGTHFNKETFKVSCALYNISKMKESTSEMVGNTNCEKSEAEKLEDTMEERNSTLKSSNLTTDDLFTWGKWYIESNN